MIRNHKKICLQPVTPNTVLDYKNDGSITIKDYSGNTLVQTLTQSVDFIQSIITSSNDIYETDLFT